VDDAGETSLAAATAAIITARWTATTGSGHASGTHAATAGNGHSESPDPSGDYGPTGNGNGLRQLLGLGAAPSRAASTGFDRPAHQRFRASAISLLRPRRPHGARYDYQGGRGQHAAVHADPVPEVFEVRSRVTGRSAGRVRVESPVGASGFPEPLDPQFQCLRFGDPAGEPARTDSAAWPDVPARPDLASRDEGLTQVPPGFERRTFGPLSEEPGQPAAVSHDEPRGFETIAPVGAFSGLATASPPAPLLPPAESLVMPPTFAPPEPPPWTDSGWVEFPRSDLDPEPVGALAGVGVTGRPVLPRRVPQIPDVPNFARFDSDPSPDPAAERAELSRIATFLRDDEDMAGSEPRPDGFDLAAVLAAVRGVPDVRDAHLRWNASAGHTLRIEFADGADEAEVTRAVVRLLREKMGLSAAPSAGDRMLGSDEKTWDRPIPRPRAVATARVALRPQASPEITAGQPLPRPSNVDLPRLVVDNVTVTRLGAEATVEVRLISPGRGTRRRRQARPRGRRLPVPARRYRRCPRGRSGPRGGRRTPWPGLRRARLGRTVWRS
jgi:hypothetical protein